MTSADSLSLILRRLDEIKRKLESHDGRVTSVSRPRKGDEAWAAVYSPSTSSNDKITSNPTLTGSGINWAVIALEPSGTVEHQPEVFRGFASNARGTSNKSLASFSKSASFSRVQICK